LAAAEPKIKFDVPAGPLEKMLHDVGHQADRNIIYFDSSIVQGMQATALRGEFTVEEAIEHLLAGKSLHPVKSDERTIIIERDAPDKTVIVQPPPPKDKETPEATPVHASVEEVVVNAKAGYLTDLSPLVPTITVTRQQLDDRGYFQLGDFFRQQPQNFPGISPGSSPIVGNARGAGGNQTFAVTVDWLGLGPGTTLLLLNGHRLPPSVIGQAVDISAIPVSEIDHIDIVKSGASATYGSDAVGGVVNIVTVSNYSGVEATARYGGTSEDELVGPGGSVTAGRIWSGGNGVMIFDFERDDPLYASQRGYTSSALEPTSLLPAMKIYSGVASARQDLCDRCILRADVFASRRTFDADDALNEFLTKLVGRVDQWDAVMQFDYRLSTSWNFNLAVQMATEKDLVVTTTYSPAKSDQDYYVNQAPSVESFIKGAFGGDSDPLVQLGLGAAFRQEQFAWRPSYAADVSDRRNVTSVFGEVWLPHLDKGGWLPLTQELSADLSGRYDGYDRSGSSWDPRVALRWETSDSLAWHTSFSRSFKSPTLFQLSWNEFAGVVQATNPMSPGTTLNTLLVDGGNRRLTAERSRSVELGFTYKPQAIHDLIIDVSGTDLIYTHRIDELSQDGFAATQVIADAPVLGQLVSLNPSQSQVQQVLATPGLVKTTPIDIDTVAAIANLGFANVGSIHVQAIDATVNYSHDVAGDPLIAELVGSYFVNYDVRITPQSAEASFVGAAYRPSRVRAKLDLTWPHGNWSANVRFNFTGGYHNGNDPACPSMPGCPVSAWSTFDGSVAYSIPTDLSSPLHGTRVSLSVSNAFDRAPPYLYGGGQGLNYDPANASPSGRRVAITVTKQWGEGRGR
jgi:outer membrane receptor protein involved in Fe transport